MDEEGTDGDFAPLPWWRCHRRLIADHLLARGEIVFHLMDKGRAERARLSEGARIVDAVPTYPARPVAGEKGRAEESR